MIAIPPWASVCGRRGSERGPSLFWGPQSGNPKVAFMPPKLRQLIADLEQAGFVNRGGKGSHRNFVHPKVSKPVTISGADGDDAKRYQVRAARLAIEEAKK